MDMEITSILNTVLTLNSLWKFQASFSSLEASMLQVSSIDHHFANLGSEGLNLLLHVLCAFLHFTLKQGLSSGISGLIFSEKIIFLLFAFSS